ncbi:MAG: acyl-CoA thioesterase, partial [Actinomycetota bacterium]
MLVANRRTCVLYEHRIRIRYGECDMQKVVFNAHYLAYCDDAADCWMR